MIIPYCKEERLWLSLNFLPKVTKNVQKIHHSVLGHFFRRPERNPKQVSTQLFT